MKLFNNLSYIIFYICILSVGLAVGSMLTISYYKQHPNTVIQKAQGDPVIQYKLPTSVNDKQLTEVVQKWSKEFRNREYKVEDANSDLCMLAKIRVIEIEDEFNHDGFYKLVSDKSTIKFSTLYNKDLSENLADWTIPATSPTETHEEAILRAWIYSPTHYRNLTDNKFNSICIVCNGPRCVHLFATN